MLAMSEVNIICRPVVFKQFRERNEIPGTCSRLEWLLMHRVNAAARSATSLFPDISSSLETLHA